MVQEPGPDRRISLDQMFRFLNPPTVAMPSGRKARHPGIASSLRAAITGGQIGPGERLPSSRDLSAHFGVHRNTVSEALDSLVAEGWIEAAPRRAFSVAFDLPLPEVFASRRLVAGAPNWRFVRDGPAIGSPDPASVRYALHSATPDPRLLPRDELRAAYASVLRARGRGALAVFDMGDERGLPRLVRALSTFLRRTRGLSGRELLLTHGSQEAIALVAQAMLAPGDRVAVGDPGYAPAWESFRAAGAELVPIAVDDQGIDVEALGRAMRRRPCRLVYLTPGRHYPTTVTLSAPRRVALLEMTRRAGVPVLEDDYDHEHHYRASPLPPLALEASHVIYVSTLSKAIAPGIRLGFVAAHGDSGRPPRPTAPDGHEGERWHHPGRHRRLDRRRRIRAPPAARAAGLPRAARRGVRRPRESARRGGRRVEPSPRRRVGALDALGWARHVRARPTNERARRPLRARAPGPCRARCASRDAGPRARLAFARYTPDELRIAIGIVAEEASAMSPSRAR